VKERRHIQRIEMQTPARITVMAKRKKEVSLQAETKDISSHGAFFITEYPIEKNTNLDVELFLSMDKLREIIGEKKQVRIRIQGTVIRNDPDGIAVSFGTKYQIIEVNHKQE
jgi:hypothetical protein